MRLGLLVTLLAAAARMAAATPGESPREVLRLVRQKMLDNLAGLPNYTCGLTVERSLKPRTGHRFEPLDTLRLEVALAGGRELYAWPGQEKFEEKRIDELAPGGGAIGNGDFAMHARAIFDSKAPTFIYTGETTLDGRKAVQFGFRVPRQKSEYFISNGIKSSPVGYHGSFWVDAQTLDLLRLQVQADDIPAELSVSQAEDTLDYQRVRIGAADYVLPRGSELLLVDAAGNASRNRTRFSDCRQYSGQSVLSFDAPAEPAAPARRATEVRLPQHLDLEVELTAAAGGDGAAVGDPLRGKLVRGISTQEGALFPKGAILTGHLTRLQRRRASFGDYWVVGLEFSRVETEERRAEFRASLEDLYAGSQYFLPFSFQPGGVSSPWSALRQPLPPPPASGEGVILVRGSRVRLPAGFRMLWRTLP